MMRPRLSQSELNAMPRGAKVIVTWQGGNGPHEYVLDVKDHRDHWSIRGEHGNWIGDLDLVFRDRGQAVYLK